MHPRTGTTTGYPLADLHLARRLERTEATANAAYVEARAALDPSLGAAWIDVAGTYAMFDGVGSPLTQTFGLGIFDETGEAELGRLEAFFETRGAAVAHEVSPYVAPGVLALLGARGYRPIEFSTVLVRPAGAALEGPPPAVRVRRIDAGEVALWSRVAAAGWSSESAELAEVVEGFGRVIGGARGAHCFLAYEGDEPIAAGSLFLGTDTALLAGASTVAAHRRRGGQRALLDARLRFAAAHGARLAMMVAAPGSGSQRNAERQGFRVAYTRTKFHRLPPSAPAPAG